MKPHFLFLPVLLVLASLASSHLACSVSKNPTGSGGGNNAPISSPTRDHSPEPTSTSSPTPTGTWYTPTPTLTPTMTSTPTQTFTPTVTATGTLSTPTPVPTLPWFVSNIWGLYGPGDSYSYFNIPMGVAVGAGFVAVSDEGNENVLVFNGSSGNYLYTVNPVGAAPDLYGITIDSYGELYVADNGSGEVDGYYLKPTTYTYDYTWTGQGALSGPDGVKIDAAGNLVVADYGSGAVYNLAWTDDSVLNTSSGGPVVYPADVALDASGNVYITDWNANQVVEYNSLYDFNSSFSGSNWTTPLGSQPYSLGADSEGNLFITDYTNGRIVYATPQGGYLGEIDAGGVPYYLYYLFIDPSDNLFVADATDDDVVELSKQ